jgi:DeoR/GlpR family transcriptional regulator of sugar metabolism
MAVSESTIRRDLNVLQANGIIERVRGGAFVAPRVLREPSFSEREISHRAEKELVGRAAARMVKDGETIFIDGGTTTPFIVPHLRERKELVVVTISLNVACALSEIPSISTIVIGGELHIETQVFAGPLNMWALDEYKLTFDKAFISAACVSAKNGVTNRILDRVPQKRRAIELARETAVVVDGSKVGTVAVGQVVPIQAIDYLITDETAPKEELQQISRLGPKVILANEV